MFVVRGRLTPEVGAVVCRALDAASEQLRQEAKDAETQNVEEATPARRRADALGLLAESALAATLDPGTAGDRYQVVVHVDPETLREDVSAETPVTDGRNDENVSAETPKACDGRDGHVSAETPVAGGADSGNVPAETPMTEGRSGTDVSAETCMTACDGQKIDTRSDAARVSAETSPTLARNGIVIDSTTSRPNWCGEGLDLPYVISVAWRPGDNPGAEDAA